MEGAGVGDVIVLENNLPVGIATDRDFAIKIAAHFYPIRRIMSSPLISIDPNSDLWTASDLMSTRNVRKLPVIDDGKVIGILTSSDLVKHIADH
jgi:CBS domain-containing protein